MRILFMTIAVAAAFMVAMMLPAKAAVYQQGIVYVIYDKEGDASPKDKTDLNANGVPDFVEDVATQVNAARELFNGVFNFPDPLESEHFKNATSIEVDVESKTTMGNYNGYSGRQVRKQSKHDPNERAMHFKVANTINPHKNATPAHEYFHLLQYDVTDFRNAWFKEGTARWAQDSVQKKNYPDDKDISFILEDESAAEEIFKGSYEVANQFWYPLVMEMNDKVTIPDELIKKYKYVDGSPVFLDNIIYGPNVIRAVLIKLKSKEELAAAEFGTLKEWRKKGKRAETNNKFIMDSVREVYNDKL